MSSLWWGPLHSEEVITAAYGVCISKSRCLALMEFIHDLLAVETDFIHCLHSCKCSHVGGGREPEFQPQPHWE